MRESIGAGFVVYAIVFFVALFCLFFIGGLSYTKAFKIKNRIIDIIEENECYNESASCESINQINEVLDKSGYHQKTLKDSFKCDNSGNNLVTSGSERYKYCIYKYTTTKGTYYKASAFMYFEIPVIHAHLEFPVYGETKMFREY